MIPSVFSKVKTPFVVAMLCLPTLAMLALFVRITTVEIKDIVRKSNAEIDRRCEIIADNLLKDKGSASFVWERNKGIVEGDKSLSRKFPANRLWKDWKTKSAPRKREMWGVVDDNGVYIVWVRDTTKGGNADRVYAARTDISSANIEALFLIVGIFALLALSLMTIVGIRFFLLNVKSRDNFMAAIAHDMTTPLIGMRFAIGSDDKEATILNERLIKIVENIKDFMRLGGVRKPKLTVFDIKRIFFEAYNLFADSYREIFNGQDLKISFPNGDSPLQTNGDSPLWVVADETMTIQIIWNLLANNLKYAAPFGEVYVRFYVDNKFIFIDFVDTGPGMSKEQCKKAFDRYYRTSEAMRSGKGGFGIGLCTAYEFARAMHGSLSVRPNDPSGCIFTLRLPVGKGDSPCQSEGDSPCQSEGDSPCQSEGDSPCQSEGDSPQQREGGGEWGQSLSVWCGG